jgi:electron transfer DM13
MRGFVGRHRLAVSLVALTGAGIVVFVLVWFQPQKLIIEKTVHEAAPTASASALASATELASGSFRSLEHPTRGAVHLIRLPDGSSVVRIEALDTSNGPDLRVYLSMHAADRDLHGYGDGYLDLGALKGNRGDQNYRVPAGTDIARFHSVVIWCRRFTVGFGVAPLGR